MAEHPTFLTGFERLPERDKDAFRNVAAKFGCEIVTGVFAQEKDTVYTPLLKWQLSSFAENHGHKQAIATRAWNAIYDGAQDYHDALINRAKGVELSKAQHAALGYAFLGEVMIHGQAMALEVLIEAHANGLITDLRMAGDKVALLFDDFFDTLYELSP